MGTARIRRYNPHDTLVAVVDGSVVGFVNVAFAGFTGCPQVWYARLLG